MKIEAHLSVKEEKHFGFPDQFDLPRADLII